MLIKKIAETRIQYLSRVLTEFMEGANGDETIDYDEITCDGHCLAEDIQNEIEMIEGR